MLWHLNRCVVLFQSINVPCVIEKYAKLLNCVGVSFVRRKRGLKSGEGEVNNNNFFILQNRVRYNIFFFKCDKYEEPFVCAWKKMVNGMKNVYIELHFVIKQFKAE